jgi:phosphoribosyl-AMP cyclohydrolase
MIPDLKYNDQGLIPAIIQDEKSSEVLMMAYMNRASLEKTIEGGKTCFWSRSRQTYWVKGETSGNVQLVKEILYDCDEDTLLVKVDQVGSGACHTGNRTCFFRKITNS